MELHLRYGKQVIIIINYNFLSKNYFYFLLLLFLTGSNEHDSNKLKIREGHLPDQQAKTLSWLPFQRRCKEFDLFLIIF